MPRYHRVMDFDTNASVIIEVFAVQAILGLALFALVIAVLVRAFISEHHRGEQRSHGQLPR